MNALFITSSGTGIGKTLVTATLAYQLGERGESVDVLKPVLSGFDRDSAATSDPAILLASIGADPTEEAIDRVSPWRFAAPLSPDMAALREGRSIDFDALVRLCRDRAEHNPRLLIEGVGGVMVPLTDERTVLDWIAVLSVPALLVVGSYLGTISHTLTALAAVQSSHVPCIGIVVSESEENPVSLEETCSAIGRFVSDMPIVALPRLADDRPWRTAPDLLGPLGL